MKVVLQTVLKAEVKIDGEVFSKINRGYLLLVGFTQGDDELTCDLLADKILKLRVFSDENGLTNLSLDDVKGEIMSVSQFTLYADSKKGRRPSFVYALEPKRAKELYEYFNQKLHLLSQKVIKTGVFGADMKVFSINDGPFTLLLDSEDLKK